jgi:pimeloyl-[acyl-carrier protein] methyl ester esterase
MPAGIERLALICTTPKFPAAPGWRCGTAPTLLTRLAGRLREDDARTVDDFIALSARGSAPRTSERVLRTLRAALSAYGRAHPEALASGLERLRQGDQREALPLVRVPALVVAGQHDRIIRPAATRALAAALPRGRYVEIAGAAHAPFLSHPAQFAQLLAGFLRG